MVLATAAFRFSVNQLVILLKIGVKANFSDCHIAY